jgi:hypothetical protein
LLDRLAAKGLIQVLVTDSLRDAFQLGNRWSRLNTGSTSWPIASNGFLIGETENGVAIRTGLTAALA